MKIFHFNNYIILQISFPYYVISYIFIRVKGQIYPYTKGKSLYIPFIILSVQICLSCCTLSPNILLFGTNILLTLMEKHMTNSKSNYLLSICLETNLCNSSNSFPSFLSSYFHFSHSLFYS